MRTRSHSTWITLATILLLASLPCFSAPAGVNVMGFPLEPFSMDTGDGKASGPAAAFITQMFIKAGFDAPAIGIVPLTRLSNSLDTGGTIAVALTRNPDREPKYQWVSKVWVQTFSFATLAGKPVIDTFEAAKALGRILVVKDGAPAATLKGKGITQLETSAATDANQFPMLMGGRGDAWFGGTLVLKSIIAANKAESKVRLGASLQPSELWICASKDVSPDLIRKLQAADAALKADGSYDKIFAALK